MLFRIDFDIGVYTNRVQVADRRTGRFVDFAAELPFSSPTQLVVDAVYLENALVKAIRKAMSGGFLLLDAKATVSAGSKHLSLFERQAIRGALRNIGFKAIYFGDEADPDIASGQTFGAEFAARGQA